LRFDRVIRVESSQKKNIKEKMIHLKYHLIKNNLNAGSIYKSNNV